jgi:hypothetical protein
MNIYSCVILILLHHFLLLQTGFLGCFGPKVDAIEYYTLEIERVENEVSHTAISVLTHQWIMLSFILLFHCKIEGY